MACPSWMNRGFALGTVFGLLVGAGGATAWFLTRPAPAEPARDDWPMTLATGDGMFITPTAEDYKRLQSHPVSRFLEEAKKSKARLACKSLATACEAYALHPANVEGKFPEQLTVLIAPGFGSSFLKNGVEPLVDPWGKQYKLESVKRGDGSELPLITTTAPDGTPISQFGIGEAANPKE